MVLSQINILRSAKLLLDQKGWDGAEAACDRNIERLGFEQDDLGVRTWRQIKHALHDVRRLEEEAAKPKPPSN